MNKVQSKDFKSNGWPVTSEENKDRRPFFSRHHPHFRRYGSVRPRAIRNLHLAILSLQSLLTVAALLGPSLCGLAQPFALDWWTIAGGGGTSGDGEFTVRGTIGQTDTGIVSDGTFTLEGGFWPGVSGSLVGPSPAIWTWSGPDRGDWFNTNSWTPPGVPGPSDTIYITNGGTVNLTAPVTIGRQLYWSGGGTTLSGSPLTVASGGVVIINGNGVTLGCALTNAGTVNWLGGGLVVGAGGGPVVNLPGGLWDIQCDNLLSVWGFAADAQFQNAGTVRKSAGTGRTTLWLPFYNTGYVDVLAGELDLYGGGPVDATYRAATNATVTFGGGNFVSGQAPELNGRGRCQFSGGTLTLSNDVIANLQLVGGNLVLGPRFQGGSITNLTIAGATLTGANFVTGTLNWLAGTLSSGPLTVAEGGVLNIHATGGVIFGCALTNAGTVNWLSGGLVVGPGGGPIVNLPGGLWDIQCDNILSQGGQFQNAGTVRKSLSTGQTSFWIPFYNSGVLSVLRGLVRCTAGYVQTGATLNFGLDHATTPWPWCGQLEVDSLLV